MDGTPNVVCSKPAVCDARCFNFGFVPTIVESNETPKRWFSCMTADNSEQGGALSTSRAIVAALKALQTRVEEVESVRRCEAERARERYDTKCQELQQAMVQIESLKSEFELERKQLEHHCEDIKQQRDKALADLAVSKHTIHTLRDEIKMAKSLIADTPSSNRVSKPSPAEDDAAIIHQPNVERNIDIVVPSVTESRSSSKDEQKVEELERLVYNLLQMNSKLKEDRDAVRKKLKLNLGATRSSCSARSLPSATSVPSFAQPRSRRSAVTSSASKLSQTKIKQNKDKPEPESMQRKVSKTETMPVDATQTTESKLRWIQHCIDEIAKSGRINLKTGSGNSRSRNRTNGLGR